ncbi:MAG: hypothetical protein ACTSWG_03125 [Candidatus Helarchaeota archaeon]
MSVKKDKEKIIREIMDLRTMITEITLYDSYKGKYEKKKTQEQLNKIQDMVFNI